MANTKTNEYFLNKAIERHGHRYDYSKVVYVNSRKKVIIICKTHGDFEQIPGYHLQGNGCMQCSVDGRKNSKDSFINNSNKRHGKKYDYSKVQSINGKINGKTEVTIICPAHGEFQQIPGYHLQGNGCPECGNVKRLTTETFIKKSELIHGFLYGYSKVNYINNRTKVIIICPKHGDFLQKPDQHLLGQGCAKCSGNVKYTNDEFIEKAYSVHGMKYGYFKVEYINSTTDIIIICEIHGDFLQKPVLHLQGSGCSKCPYRKKFEHPSVFKKIIKKYNIRGWNQYQKISKILMKNNKGLILPQNPYKAYNIKKLNQEINA